MSKHGFTSFSFISMKRVYQQAPVFELSPDHRIVVFSDLHMGNGGATDDFRANGEMFNAVLRDHYLDKHYQLILNGDVEDLQRFRLHSIQRRWPETFELFDAFAERTALYRLFGNHDMALRDMRHRPEPLYEGIRWRYGGNELFIFHGHQTAPRYAGPNRWIDFVLRYIANPLRIGNRTVSHSSRRKIKVEQRVYYFASTMKVLSIIGHTHRPLFESLSKLDEIKFEIENLCRRYTELEHAEQRDVADRITYLKDELEVAGEDPEAHEPAESLYNANLLVPCMFNSGGVIGKRGMTCIELEGNKLRLVYWFDAVRSQTYFQYRRHTAEQLPGTDYYRVVIKEDTLDYIFARIQLLS